MNEIIIENEQKLIKINKGIEEVIKRAINQALKHESLDKRIEIGVTLVDNETIKRINMQERNINQVTDVLSFPMLELESGNTDTIIKYDITDYNHDLNTLLLGDIVISMEKAKEQSIEYGHSFERELAFLIVHSTLHLLGYDHILNNDRLIMRDKEERILEILQLKR